MRWSIFDARLGPVKSAENRRFAMSPSADGGRYSLAFGRSDSELRALARELPALEGVAGAPAGRWGRVIRILTKSGSDRSH